MSAGSRILVVRAGALGDTLMATPLLRALQARFGRGAVDFLGSRGAAPLIAAHPAVARTFVLRWRNVPYALSPEKWKLARTFAQAGYEFAVLLEEASRYRVLLERAGIADIRSYRETPFDAAAHAIVNNLRVAGFSAAEVALDMEVFWSQREAAVAEELLAKVPGPRVGIHVGYGPRGRKNRQSERLKGWPLARFEELAVQLVRRGVSVVFTGSDEDRADVARVATALPAERRLDLAGRTSVMELAAAIRMLDVFVSVDTGPAHLAAAVGTPLVVLWGPAILAQVRPLSTRSPVSILRHPPPCAPCYDTPLMKTCRRNICMEAIASHEVLLEVLTLLGRRGSIPLCTQGAVRGANSGVELRS